MCYKSRVASGVQTPRPVPREHEGNPQLRNQDVISARKWNRQIHKKILQKKKNGSKVLE